MKLVIYVMGEYFERSILCILVYASSFRNHYNVHLSLPHHPQKGKKSMFTSVRIHR